MADPRIENDLTIWLHQNELLWGRIQTISAIQAGVIAGWYSVLQGTDPDFSAAILLAALGVILSGMTWWIVLIDLKLRRFAGKSLRKDGILPPASGQVHGYHIMHAVCGLFFEINLILAAVTWIG